MEKVLPQFIYPSCASNIPVSVPMLLEKAKEIAMKLNLADCGFTVGWLQKFKARHGITCQFINGETRDFPVDSVAEGLKILLGIISEYQLKDIFYAEETGFIYRLMPNRTLSEKGENVKERKISKNRSTVLICANCDGSGKITPLV